MSMNAMLSGLVVLLLSGAVVALYTQNRALEERLGTLNITSV